MSHLQIYLLVGYRLQTEICNMIHRYTLSCITALYSMYVPHSDFHKPKSVLPKRKARIVHKSEPPEF